MKRHIDIRLANHEPRHRIAAASATASGALAIAAWLRTLWSTTAICLLASLALVACGPLEGTVQTRDDAKQEGESDLDDPFDDQAPLSDPSAIDSQPEPDAETQTGGDEPAPDSDEALDTMSSTQLCDAACGAILKCWEGWKAAECNKECAGDVKDGKPWDAEYVRCARAGDCKKVKKSCECEWKKRQKKDGKDNGKECK